MRVFKKPHADLTLEELHKKGSSIDSHENAFDDMKQLINEDENEQKSSLPSASFNFINSIIGSGVIGIPYALHEAGFGFGLFLLVFVAYVTDYSLILMIKAGHISGRFSYQGIMEAAFGRPGYYLLGALQFFYPFIAMVSYNVVVGDTVTKVIIRLVGLSPHNIFAKRQVIVLIATVFITVPLCLYRDISKLAKISFFSLVCIGFILFSILLRIGKMSEIVPKHQESWRFFNQDIIPAIGIMAFAFMCHHNTFLIYSSIADASQKKWETVTHASILTSLVVACLFGIAGYATFKAHSQGDLLENYCWDDDLMNVSRLLFSVQILLTYPIECFVSREVIENTVLGRDPNVPISEKVHYGLTLSIIVTTYLISMATDCLGVVLELNGVLAAVPLAYVLPALCYLRLEEGFVLNRNKLPALGVAIFGTTVAALGVIFLFLDIDKVNECSHDSEMPYCAIAEAVNNTASDNILSTVTTHM
ncbi:putative sodium-coupled neutral amino acid transporter 11 isoform X2 [Cylas formicarius]|uniref:putative sodium-coupled neutral amino acid transporter 11 isoform X2 n=1 Tax=Cylas formicarius TaxID=197179 RepID=UPI002958C8B2|nr:putative sodium-coupled neutral amino acid transporter 11 isoform X2 [Cylas formicarius]